MTLSVAKTGFSTCSASTTASNSQKWEKPQTIDQLFKGEVICDWLSFRHDFDLSNPTKIIAAGKTLKLNADNSTEWEKQDFTTIKCPSSDTSIRIKCDGNHLWFQGNIGRFQNSDNVTGLTVMQCIEKAGDLIRKIYPEIDMRFFGTTQRQGTPAEHGTVITRLDLASNFETDNYLLLSQLLGQRRINQRIPRPGKYGPTWGYDTKRGQYWKAKLYDKTAEQDGKRTPNTHETLARFEIQLGSEYLRQNKLNHVKQWAANMKTENIIYGKFANQLLVEQATYADWSEFPPKLRQHAIIWRDGVDPKTYLSKSAYYRVRNELRDLGLDISSPCNVMNLVAKVKTVNLYQAPTLRRVA